MKCQRWFPRIEGAWAGLYPLAFRLFSFTKRLLVSPLMLGLLPLLLAFTAAEAQDLPFEQMEKPIPEAAIEPKLETVLQLISATWQVDRARAFQIATQAGVEITAENMVRVIIEPEEGLSENVSVEALSLLGGVIEARSRSLLRVKVPIDKLRELARTVPGVKFVRQRRFGVPCKLDTSEGVSLTGATDFHAAGVEGQGVQVAIIDVGFDHLTEAIASGDLPSSVYTHDYTGTGLESGTNHGTDVAEIIYDMAPKAELYLWKVADSVDLENAKDNAISYGIDVINHSVGWFNFAFYDGTGTICDIAADARDHDIIWVNSAGNDADSHWQGSWYSPDGDWWLDFSAGDEINDLGTISQNARIKIWMTWDAWPNDAEDYDLFLYKIEGGTVTEVASSENYQTGTQPPREAIYYTVPTTGVYGFAIKRYDAPGAPDIEVFIAIEGSSMSLQYVTHSSSLPDPANDEKVVTVGAIGVPYWTTGPQEYFSSQGPTNNSKYAFSRTKPDIMGPDRVSTSGYGSFWGTSAASPHVAGYAALLRSQHPDWPAWQVENEMFSTAIDMGTSGKDNIYGYGRMNCVYTGEPDLYDDGETWRWFSPQQVCAGVTGQSFEIHCDIRNGGNAASGPFKVRFYASENTYISEYDYYIGTVNMSGIAAGDWANCDWSGTFPTSIPAGTYYIGWIIDADNEVAESDESNNTAYKQGYQLKVYGGPPPVPTGVTASDGTYSDRVRVTWNSVGDATRYDVYRAQAGCGTYTKIGEATTTTYDDFSVVAGKVYWYRVKACNPCGCSGYSNSASGYAGSPAPGTSATFRVERSTGNVYTDGAYHGQCYYSGSADVAEWVPVSEPVEPGDVLEIDPENPGHYRKARGPCSQLVAGVVSTEPGFVLGHGEDTEGKVLLALMGIVPVKVTDEGGPIRPGDLLVVSSTPGYAMRWDPDSGLCGFVGKALEPWEEGEGVILVLLMR